MEPTLAPWPPCRRTTSLRLRRRHRRPPDRGRRAGRRARPRLGRRRRHPQRRLPAGGGRAGRPCWRARTRTRWRCRPATCAPRPPARPTLTVAPGPGRAGRSPTRWSPWPTPAGPALTVQATTATLGTTSRRRTRGRCPTSRRSRSASPLAEHARPRPARRAGARAALRVDTRLDPATAGWAFGRPSGEPVHAGLDAVRRRPRARPAGAAHLRRRAAARPASRWATWAGRRRCSCRCWCARCRRPGWCLVEARASEIAGGWVDEDYRIWDSTGRLVAQSRQLARAPR